MRKTSLNRLDFLKLGSAAISALPLISAGELAGKDDKSAAQAAKRSPDNPARKKYPAGRAHQEHLGWHTVEESGSEMGQLTGSPLIHENIYPEAPVFTPDSRFFVYARRSSADRPREYWLCETGSWRLFPLTDETPVSGPVVSPDGEYLYYVWSRESGESVLVRKNLWSGEREELIVADGLKRIYALGTMSPDGRYYATAARLPDRSTGIIRFDTVERSWKTIHSRIDIFNAHPQWDPGQRRDIMIQHNRGGSLNEFGEFAPMVGPEGATLYLIDYKGDNVRPLHVGKPYTPSVQGHECWLGRTGKMLVTLTDDVEFGGKKGNLVALEDGKDPVIVAGGLYFWHVSSSPDGKYFVCDDTSGNIYIGLSATGQYRRLCQSETILGAQQYTHTHPFISPDCRYVFFNSTRTGIPQIYAASVPEEFLDSLGRVE